MESVFQSTLPVWGGTGAATDKMDSGRGFNPPSPCGEGPLNPRSSFSNSRFQSTLPVWGGTAVDGSHVLPVAVSIHPPRVGRDSKSSQKFFVNFCARRQYYQNF